MSVVLDWLQKPNPEMQQLSIQTWFAKNLKRQKKTAQEIIRANVSFCFTANRLFTCNPQVQREPYLFADHHDHGCHEGIQRQDVLGA